MALRYTAPYFQWIDGNGNPLAGGYLYFYASGTSTPLATYSDSGLTIANTNPVEANSEGYWGPIYLQAADYKVVLKDADGVQVWTADPVSGSSGSGQSSNIRTVTTDTTLVPSDGTILCNSASPIQITLPTASAVRGLTYTVVQINTGEITVVGTINGVTNYTMSFANQAASFVSNGVSYVVK